VEKECPEQKQNLAYCIQVDAPGYCYFPNTEQLAHELIVSIARSCKVYIYVYIYMNDCNRSVRRGE